MALPTQEFFTAGELAEILLMSGIASVPPRFRTPPQRIEHLLVEDCAAQSRLIQFSRERLARWNS